MLLLLLLLLPSTSIADVTRAKRDSRMRCTRKVTRDNHLLLQLLLPLKLHYLQLLLLPLPHLGHLCLVSKRRRITCGRCHGSDGYGDGNNAPFKNAGDENGRRIDGNCGKNEQ